MMKHVGWFTWHRHRPSDMEFSKHELTPADRAAGYVQARAYRRVSDKTEKSDG